MKTEVERLLKAAEAYACYSVERLFVGSESGACRAELQAGMQKVHYLFPNLTRAERLKLAGLKSLNHGITAGVNADTRGMTRAEREVHESVITALEAKFVALRRALRDSGLPARLTPIQKEILECEFLKIEFNEAG